MDSDLVTRISILSWRGAEHITYPVEVSMASGQKWTVERVRLLFILEVDWITSLCSQRYSEFEDLHNALVFKEVKVAMNFDFPEKKWFGHSADCLDSRQRDFESYLSDLILVSPPLVELYEFLEVGKPHSA